MVRFWFSSEQEECQGFAVLGFVRSAVAAAMGCFFGCFRIRDSHLALAPEPAVSRGKSVLSSLFISDDESRGEGEERQNLLPEGVDFMEFKDEAKFLKACGTLPVTPAEIRKASEKWECVLAQNGEEKSSSNLLSHNVSTEKLKLEKLSDESPIPIKLFEESDAGAGSPEDTPSSCMTEYNTRRGSISSNDSSPIKSASAPIDVCDCENHSATSPVSPLVFAPSLQGKNKSVRFDCEPIASEFSSNGTSSESGSQHSKQSGSASNSNTSASRPSPYPTPLKITDDMQTPGTVFPSYIRNMNTAKTTGIRSQYVYSSINPLENPSQLKEDISDSDHLEESLILNDEATLMPSPESDMALKAFSVGEEMKYEASLSSWLKPPSSEQDGNNEQFDSISDDNIDCGRTPGDMPVLGVVPAHHNGIPNSTKKYKEDQRVCWHGTPFEERLEKALCADTVIHTS